VLEGVTFNGDDIDLFAYPNTQNHIQYVDSWTDEPAGDVVLATINAKPVMHASTSQKYFALGLSCDDFTKYNANAITIVKNAAAMLIAGTALDTEVSTVSGTISASGWNTFSSSYALDLSSISGGTAYVATAAADGKVTLTSTTAKVASGEGLMIKGTAGDAFTIDVTTDAATLSETNLLVGLPNGGSVTEGDNNYIFGWPTADPTSYGFYYVNESGATLGAGKAYLHTASALAPSLSIDFGEGETTGINTVQGSEFTVNGEYYNLAGQRVAQPTKGLYIVNGRKVVIK
jgi:hypothetical protein